MKIDWNLLPSAPGMRAGSERKATCGEEMSAVRVTTAPATKLDGKAHSHDNEQMLIMLAGGITLSLDGVQFEAHPDDLVFLPPGSMHCAVGVSKEGAVCYELFAPARADQFRGWIGPSVLQY